MAQALAAGDGQRGLLSYLGGSRYCVAKQPQVLSATRSRTMEEFAKDVSKAPRKPLHRFWQCPDNIQSDDRRNVDSQHLCRHAERQPHRACFWHRGVPTQSMLKVEPPPEICDVLEVGDFELPLLGNKYLVYGDGSGGPFSSDPLLRRCGRAWVSYL